MPASYEAFSARYAIAFEETARPKSLERPARELTVRQRLLQQLLLVLFSTPDEHYSTDAAARLLRGFDDSDQSELLSHLRAASVIGSRGRRAALRAQQLSREYAFSSFYFLMSIVINYFI